MIRKFEKNDINPVMQIWKNENIKAHKFISKEYWKNNYNYVKEILPNAEIYVYVLKENIESCGDAQGIAEEMLEVLKIYFQNV